MQSRRKRKTLILSILVVGLFVIWTVVPIYMLISQSVKPESIMFADPPKLFYQPIFDHFVRSLTAELKAELTQTKAELEAKYHSLMDANRLYVGMRGRLNGS